MECRLQNRAFSVNTRQRDMIAVDIGEAQESLLSGFVGKGLNLFWQKKSQMIAAKALPDEKVPSLNRRDV